MSYRDDVTETLGGAINVALKKEYDRGWDDCMKYFWKKREEEDAKRKSKWKISSILWGRYRQ